MSAQYPIVIKSYNGDYTVTLHNANYATVEGGVLPQATSVRKLLAKGDSNPKTSKNTVVTKGLSLYPHKGIGFGNVCPNAKNCVKSCLADQGQGKVPNVKAARVARTVLYYLARKWFLAKLNRELYRFRKSYPSNIVLGVRLNMFSDIPWEQFGIMENHPHLQFYDYSKNPRRWGMVRPNYWVTFSYDGTNEATARTVLATGGNVAVVFYNEDGKCGKAAHRQTIPNSFLGRPTLDGGVTDWRPDDQRGHVVALRLLARTYKDRNEAINSGFAVLTK